MARSAEDRFSNVATVTVVESAANTLTFVELATGISLGQGIGMLIDQLDYYVNTVSRNLIVGALDELVMAWTANRTMTSVQPDVPGVIHTALLQNENVVGTPASNAAIARSPLVHQFFPPMIVAAPRLYCAVQGGSLGSAATVRFRMYFRYIPLTDKEYLELAEAFILVG